MNLKQGQNAHITTVKQLRAKYNNSMEFIIQNNNQLMKKDNNNTNTKIHKMLILLQILDSNQALLLINLCQVIKKLKKMVKINLMKNKTYQKIAKNKELSKNKR